MSSSVLTRTLAFRPQARASVKIRETFPRRVAMTDSLVACILASHIRVGHKVLLLRRDGCSEQASDRSPAFLSGVATLPAIMPFTRFSARKRHTPRIFFTGLWEVWRFSIPNLDTSYDFCGSALFLRRFRLVKTIPPVFFSASSL